jgi:RNA polymerase sigma-70 factor, ECF subfamily
MNLALQALATMPKVASAAHRDAGARVRWAFEAHFDFIWRSARRLGVSAAEADDAAQGTFVVFSRRIDEVEPGRERAFLFATMTRVIADVRKSAARRYEVGAEPLEYRASEAQPADEALDAGRARVVLDRALQMLPLEVRCIFVLFELEELTMAEIAQLLELAPGTVASRLRKARVLFQDAILRAQNNVHDACKIRGRHE